LSAGERYFIDGMRLMNVADSGNCNSLAIRGVSGENPGNAAAAGGKGFSAEVAEITLRPKKRGFRVFR